jgi:hypothetical protein
MGMWGEGIDVVLKMGNKGKDRVMLERRREWGEWGLKVKGGKGDIVEWVGCEDKGGKLL